MQILPWLVTAMALHYAFQGVDWRVLLDHLTEVKPGWIALAVILTCSSYFIRTRRWQSLFLNPVLRYAEGYRVLVLGFFMNNVLPARTGELVRAHLGSKVTGETRTLVLATIANERLIDGLVISFMFLAFAGGMGGSDMSDNLLYVAALFGLVGVGVVATLLLRKQVFTLVRSIDSRFNHRAATYTLDRIQIFIEGLAPMWTRKRLPFVVLWSLIVWGTELAVFTAVARAYGADLSLAENVLFLVSVNFASLIPAAPGGIGVVEAIGSKALMSVGIPQELALTIVLTQHAIQYLVVGIPGLFLMFRVKGSLQNIEGTAELQSATHSTGRSTP
jgi:uncharacterized protein (TIRG00374 family)